MAISLPNISPNSNFSGDGSISMSDLGVQPELPFAEGDVEYAPQLDYSQQTQSSSTLRASFSYQTKPFVYQVSDNILYGGPPDYPVTIAGETFEELLPRNLLYTIKLRPVLLKYDEHKTILNAWSIDRIRAWKSFREYFAKVYKDLLKALRQSGVNVSKLNLILPFSLEACYNDPPFVEFVIQNPKVNLSIANQYGQSIFEKTLDFTTSMLSQLAYLSNQQIVSFLKSQFGVMGTMAEEIAKGLVGAPTVAGIEGLASLGFGALNLLTKPLQWAGSAAANRINENFNSQELTREIKQGVTQILKGARIDLPDIWDSSNVSWSISLQIILASSTAHLEAFINRVIIPLLYLATLSMPRSSQSYFYIWPFQVEVEFPSGFRLPIAAITNFSFEFDKKPAISKQITVSLSIQPLYHVMFLEPTDGTANQIPEGIVTFNRYISTLVQDISKYLKL